ncbi:MAG: hypothetical protein COW65_03995 [Cytophagales bacterium CG18_big_fil_WC_8_21_14_2_50_42_9]|nr:MAG: hypothetical protein COW65_03995 [Cytophagales bacterium CG18_big_fil_WC_8_21_14_2_50_42_9]
MIQHLNGPIRNKLVLQAEKIGLKGQEAIDVITTTKNTIKEVLQAELKSDKYNEVLTFLKHASVNAGKDLIFDKIIQRVVSRLILRFGFPQTLAVSLATLLVPFLLKRLGNKALKSGKVQDLFLSLGVRNRVEKLSILKNQIINKFNYKQAA